MRMNFKWSPPQSRMEGWWLIWFFLTIMVVTIHVQDIVFFSLTINFNLIVSSLYIWPYLYIFNQFLVYSNKDTGFVANLCIRITAGTDSIKYLFFQRRKRKKNSEKISRGSVQYSPQGSPGSRQPWTNSTGHHLLGWTMMEESIPCSSTADHTQSDTKYRFYSNIN